jgi:hypothetical protein
MLLDRELALRLLEFPLRMKKHRGCSRSNRRHRLRSPTLSIGALPMAPWAPFKKATANL